MTTQEIVDGLAIPIKNKFINKHAAGIAAIYSLLEREQRHILSTNVVDAGKILFGGSKIEERGKVINEFEAKAITAETSKGKYSFTVPIGAVYHSFCKLLNIKYDEMKKQNTQEKPLLSVKVPAEFADCLQEARAFVSNDKLRPALGCILIEVEKDHVQIIATDAHRLYMSRKFKIDPIEKKQPDFLIVAADLPKKKLEADEPFEVTITADHISFLEKDFELQKEKFPQYRVVVPSYDRYVEFNRKDLIQAVKQVFTYSNKGANTVSLLIKEGIELAAQDVDFSNEASVRLNWVEKTVRDMAISFHGKLLLSVLESFDSKTLKVYTDGSSKKAGIFTDGIDTILLMPQSDDNLKVSYLTPETYSKPEAPANRQFKPVGEVLIDKDILELEKEFGERFVFDKTKGGSFRVLVIDDYPKEVNIPGVISLPAFKAKLKVWESNNPSSPKPEGAPAPTPKAASKRKKADEDDEEMVVTSSGKLEKRKKAWLTDAAGLTYEKWLPFWVRYGRLEKAKQTGNTVRKERLINQSKNTYNKYLKATN